MDISMPEVDGLEATRQLHKELPETAVLILTMHESEEVVREVLNSGARGYVLKSDLDRNLLLGVEALAAGKPFFSAKVSELVLNGYLKFPLLVQASQRACGAPHPTPERGCAAAGGRQDQQRSRCRLGDKRQNRGNPSNSESTRKSTSSQSFSDLVRYAVREKLVPLEGGEWPRGIRSALA